MTKCRTQKEKDEVKADFVALVVAGAFGVVMLFVLDHFGFIEF